MYQRKLETKQTTWWLSEMCKPDHRCHSTLLSPLAYRQPQLIANRNKQPHSSLGKMYWSGGFLNWEGGKKQDLVLPPQPSLPTLDQLLCSLPLQPLPQISSSPSCTCDILMNVWVTADADRVPAAHQLSFSWRFREGRSSHSKASTPLCPLWVPKGRCARQASQGRRNYPLTLCSGLLFPPTLRTPLLQATLRGTKR